MPVAELETRASQYQAEYEFRRRYGQALEERAMGAITPVLDEEATQPPARQQIADILSGRVGTIQLSEAAVQALAEADLLAGSIRTSYQLDDPGWRDVDQRGGRYFSYFVRLPGRAEKGRSISSVGVRLSAEQISVGRHDFTRWVLER